MLLVLLDLSLRNYDIDKSTLSISLVRVLCPVPCQIFRFLLSKPDNLAIVSDIASLVCPLVFSHEVFRSMWFGVRMRKVGELPRAHPVDNISTDPEFFSYVIISPSFPTTGSLYSSRKQQTPNLFIVQPISSLMFLHCIGILIIPVPCAVWSSLALLCLWTSLFS